MQMLLGDAISERKHRISRYKYVYSATSEQTINAGNQRKMRIHSPHISCCDTLLREISPAVAGCLRGTVKNSCCCLAARRTSVRTASARHISFSFALALRTIRRARTLPPRLCLGCLFARLCCARPRCLRRRASAAPLPRAHDTPHAFRLAHPLSLPHACMHVAAAVCVCAYARLPRINPPRDTARAS